LKNHSDFIDTKETLLNTPFLEGVQNTETDKPAEGSGALLSIEIRLFVSLCYLP